MALLTAFARIEARIHALDALLQRRMRAASRTVSR
jgi:hypothetical protein